MSTEQFDLTTVQFDQLMAAMNNVNQMILAMKSQFADVKAARSRLTLPTSRQVVATSSNP